MSKKIFVESWRHLRPKRKKKSRPLVPKSSKWKIVETWNLKSMYLNHMANIMQGHNFVYHRGTLCCVLYIWSHKVIAADINWFYKSEKWGSVRSKKWGGRSSEAWEERSEEWEERSEKWGWEVSRKRSSRRRMTMTTMSDDLGRISVLTLEWGWGEEKWGGGGGGGGGGHGCEEVDKWGERSE